MMKVTVEQRAWKRVLLREVPLGYGFLFQGEPHVKVGFTEHDFNNSMRLAAGDTPRLFHLGPESQVVMADLTYHFKLPLPEESIPVERP